MDSLKEAPGRVSSAAVVLIPDDPAVFRLSIAEGFLKFGAVKGFIFLSVAMFFVVGCQMPQSSRIASAAAPNEPALIVEFPNPFPVSEVHRAVVDSLTDRRWQLGQITDTSVRASLVHRGFESNIHVEVKSSGIEIYSDSWRIDRQGERLNPEHPDGWLRNIERDVRRSLGLSYF